MQVRKKGWFEKIADIFGIVKLPVPSELKKRYEKEILFCHLNTTPEKVFSTSVFFPLTIFTTLILLLHLINSLNGSIFLIVFVFSVILFYFLFNYTKFLTIYYRSKAASEMALAIVYMSVAMKINKNLESSIAFTAENLSGPLGLDFKKMLWDLQTGNKISAIEAIDELSEKWRAESEEFVDSLNLIKEASIESPERIEMSLKEAVDIMLEGTKARMKKYALAMRTPLKIISTFGILLPLLFLIFIPVLVIFVPGTAKPSLIVFSYDFFLPSVIFLMLKKYFYTRPYSYHQIEIKNERHFRRRKKILLYFFISFAVITFSSLVFKLSVSLNASKISFSTSQFNISLASVTVIYFSIILYEVLTSFSFIQKNKVVKQIEMELPVFLFQIGAESVSGKPVENIMENVLKRIRELKIRELVEKILLNIKNFGMSLESAIFDKSMGAIRDYPSRMLYASLKVMIDISKKGSYLLSSSLKTFSRFLRDAAEVNNQIEEILSDITSEIQVIHLIFAPITAGIVIGMMGIVIYIFSYFGHSFQGLEEFLGTSSFRSVGENTFSFFLNIGKQIPFPYFQISVGVYLLEVVFMLSSFLGEIRFGDDEINKMFETGKALFISFIIYFLVVVSMFYGMKSFMNLSSLGGFGA